MRLRIKIFIKVHVMTSRKGQREDWNTFSCNTASGKRGGGINSMLGMDYGVETFPHIWDMK